MKITNNLGESNVEIIGQSDINEFRIEDSALPILIDSLINLYENPIGSIVRELTSNAADATTEKFLKLNKKRPLDTGDDLKFFSTSTDIHISFVNNYLGQGSSIIFQDEGVGLSEERVREIYTVFGNSSKRVDNNEIGGFGLGSKSAFAYANTFYVVTVRNGQEFTYMLSRNSSIPTMELISVINTPLLNGSKVIIPIDNSSDLAAFKAEIQEQLPFFKNLYINQQPVQDFVNIAVLKETPLFKIVGPKNLNTHDFQTSMENKILIGQVTYPINLKLLDIHSLKNAGLFLKFDIGEIDLIPSREAIRYTESTIKKIQKSLKAVTSFIDSFIPTDIVATTNIFMVFTKILALSNSYSMYFPYYYKVTPKEIELRELYTFIQLTKLSTLTSNTSIDYNGVILDAPIIYEILHNLSISFVERKTSGIFVRNAIKRLGKTTLSMVLSVSDLYVYAKMASKAIDTSLIDSNETFLRVCLNNFLALTKDSYDTYNKSLWKEVDAFISFLKKNPSILVNTIDYDAVLPKSLVTTLKSNHAAKMRKLSNKVFYRHMGKSGSNIEPSWHNKESLVKDINSTFFYGFEADKKYFNIVHQLFQMDRKINYETFCKIAKKSEPEFLAQKAQHISNLFINPPATFKEKVTLYALNNSYLSSVYFLRKFNKIAPSIHKEYVKLMDLKNSCPDRSFDIPSILPLCQVQSVSQLYEPWVVQSMQILKSFTKDLELLAFVNFLVDSYGYNYNHNITNLTKDQEKLIKDFLIKNNKPLV